MGGSARQSSMTVKKRGMSEPVVLPYLVVGDNLSRGGDGGKDRRSRWSASSSSTTTNQHHGRQQHHSHNRRRRQQQRQQHAATKTHHQDARREEDVEDDIDDDDLFSPVSSDIESDLDILDQSEFTHEFPEGKRQRVKRCSEKIVHDIERENKLLGIRHSQHYLRDERDGEEEDDDLLQDLSDEEDDEEVATFDMSGM